MGAREQSKQWGVSKFVSCASKRTSKWPSALCVYSLIVQFIGATRSSICSFSLTVHSFGDFTLLALIPHSATFIFFACTLTHSRAVGKWRSLCPSIRHFWSIVDSSKAGNDGNHGKLIRFHADILFFSFSSFFFFFLIIFFYLSLFIFVNLLLFPVFI